MYAGIKKGSLATATDAPTSGPLSLTSETTVGTASNNSIAKSVNTVNDSLSQSGAGVIWETPENEVSEWIRDQAAVLDAIGKEFGYRFLIRSSLLGGKANGQTVPGSREIVLSADSMEEALLYWAGHEVIHDLQVSYPEGYEEISRQVLEYLGQQERFDLNRRKQQLIREYRRGGLELTEEEAEEEIVCNGAAVAFADEDFIRGMCGKKPESVGMAEGKAEQPASAHPGGAGPADADQPGGACLCESPPGDSYPVAAVGGDGAAGKCRDGRRQAVLPAVHDHAHEYGQPGEDTVTGTGGILPQQCDPGQGRSSSGDVSCHGCSVHGV